MTKLNIWDDSIGNRPATLALFNNFTATTVPGVGNDSTQGYEVGSEWDDVTTGAIYKCTSAAVGAATWVLLDTSGAGGAGATEQKQVAAPTAPASTSVYAMQGLAGTITPNRSGTVLLTISGTATGSTVTAGDGLEWQLSYGTGAAPANAGAVTGTQVGAVQENTNPAAVTAADVHTPFSITAVITGLTLGTAYWLDLAAKSIATASSGALANVSVTAVEL
jgi:hypothetical protein